MLVDFTPRLYQQTILGTVVNNNTLTVLPTGMGKTAIAFLLAAQRLKLYPESKIVLLAPTKPLCEQHKISFAKHLNIPEHNITVFTGAVQAKKRQELWKEAKVIISTPQGLENDLINKRISFQDVSALIFDEAHHATGEYSYVWLAEIYQKTASNPRILALTASPGSDLEKIQEICKNLSIEKVELRTEKDPDVKPYIQKTETEWIELKFPAELKKVQDEFKIVVKKKLKQIKALGLCNTTQLNKGQLLRLQKILQSRIGRSQVNYDVLKALSLLAEVLKVEHALELLECQSLTALNVYLNKLFEQARTSKTKAVKNLAIDPNFKAAHHLTQSLIERQIQHPKVEKLSKLVMQEIATVPQTKIIVFTNFRDSAQEIANQLQALAIKHQIFVGQAKKGGLGLSQKQQKEVLDKFRAGEFQVLVATSVAEEGLDIPKVNQVIFYEPTASAIRNIQRRGRTGRLEQGSVKVMYVKGTRDEAYRWAAFHKEKNMYKVLDKLRSDLKYLINEKSLQDFSTAKKVKQKTTLNKFLVKETPPPPPASLLKKEITEQQTGQQNIAILADHRENNNKVLKELLSMGIPAKSTQLNTADYVVSGQVGVELKKVPDFVNSILDRRLLQQVRTLKESFPQALLIIEGEEDIYAQRNIHPNAIRGALASIVLGYAVPVLYTKDARDTAELLAVMAKREQGKAGGKVFNPHQSKPQSLKEQQEYAVASLPNIGMGTAKKLLKHFGSIKKLVNADEKGLQEAKGVGKTTAKRLTDFFKEPYKKKK